jgi:hypothetical protein
MYPRDVLEYRNGAQVIERSGGAVDKVSGWERPKIAVALSGGVLFGVY